MISLSGEPEAFFLVWICWLALLAFVSSSGCFILFASSYFMLTSWSLCSNISTFSFPFLPFLPFLSFLPFLPFLHSFLHNCFQVAAVIRFLIGVLFIFVYFSAGFGFFWVPGSMLSCFSAFLLLCFSAFCFPCFSTFPAFLLLSFSAFCFPTSLLFCFSVFPASLLFCFCASVPFYFYYSSFSFFQSCVFAALLPSPLLLCFLSLLPLCFFLFFCLLLSCLYPK